ncbi:hypothetical protein HO133_006932 [Letharia lupina]|uniref:C2H2-type domain-containing protein n=1 Tax=Letharia lupina TaxID=560253 RepID=A0A8H6F6U6_9LECA|nr:uncharacterized protein HO133_006932 [Letharia lupina]KAF6217416.1 hypothetical protein HO133_006932 [Letharia lupina]
MAYVAQNSGAEGSGFEYPPVPNAYPDPYSTFDTINAYNLHHVPALKDRAEPEPSHDHSHGYQTVAFSNRAPPNQVFYPYPGSEVPPLRRIAPAPSPTSSLENGVPSSSASMDPAASSAAGTNISFVSYSTKDGYKKRSRGTTGSIVCDKCGYKFTVASSLSRHNKTCRGKKRVNHSTSTQRKTIKPKNVSMASVHIIDALPITKPRGASSEERSQFVESKANLHAMQFTSTVVDYANSHNASLIPVPNTTDPDSQKPFLIQSYVPQGPDTSTDHKTFFCDICPGTFARRDILQVHKARIHGLTEIPYMPESGIIDRPRYLTGVTFDTANKHSRLALKTFEGGGLSSSPCQPCTLDGLECIVNPFSSSKCSYCNHRDNGRPCGAAGVKYLTADYQNAFVANQPDFQAVYEEH